MQGSTSVPRRLRFAAWEWEQVPRFMSISVAATRFVIDVSRATSGSGGALPLKVRRPWPIDRACSIARPPGSGVHASAGITALLG